jgi:hypothetical protein
MTNDNPKREEVNIPEHLYSNYYILEDLLHNLDLPLRRTKSKQDCREYCQESAVSSRHRGYFRARYYMFAGRVIRSLRIGLGKYVADEVTNREPSE